MTPDQLNLKAYTVSDEILFSCIEDSLLQACRMVAPSCSKDAPVILFKDGGLCTLIRKFFNDFTMNQLSSAIQSGTYGLWGQYSKVTGQIINEWLKKKRDEIWKEEEEKEKRDLSNRREKSVLSCRGGDAILLGFYYDDKKIKKPEFMERLRMVTENSMCPFTKRPVMDIVKEYVKYNCIL